MTCTQTGSADEPALTSLFADVFTDAEGDAAGASIRKLVRRLGVLADGPDVFGYAASDGGRLVGAIYMSRLMFQQPVEAFLLSPVAVRTDCQGRGIGQRLITHALRDMKSRGVRLVATYGDPAFYSKVGFRPISEDVIRPPFRLSQPDGWLGQTLSDDPLDAFTGSVSCVDAFDDPALW